MAGSPFMVEFKRQASFFIKEKIKTTRLALTDVTPAQLLTEEATSEDVWPPDARSMGAISKAAFEIDDYWRIVEIVHHRLINYDEVSWRVCYKTLLLLEHLLTHGPLRVAEEFERRWPVIRKMASFFGFYNNEKGLNWGLSMRNLSRRVVKLIEDGKFLIEERTRLRKLTRGIQGFGSINNEQTSTSDSSDDDEDGQSPDSAGSRSPDSTGGFTLTMLTRLNSNYYDCSENQIHSYEELPTEDDDETEDNSIECHHLLVTSDNPTTVSLFSS